MNTLVAKIQRQHLFQPGETVVVAVSGGADSVVLLDLLSRLEPENLRLVVAHLNHGLRGEESDGDESFVRGLAARYGLPFAFERAEVAGLAKSLRLSLEDAGRKARYDFLTRTAREVGAASIALAHHLDDQAETVLMRLLRGSGGTGLSAMTSLSAGMLKRPLLKVSRAEIERYLKKAGLSFRKDSSNDDTSLLRNRVRHELLPLLAGYNPKIAQRLAATAEILAGDEELLEELTESAYLRLARPVPGRPEFPVEELKSQPRGLRLRLYRRALRELRGDLQRIALSHLEAIDALVASERPNCRIKLPGECLAVRSYGALRFCAAPEPSAPAFEVTVEGPGSHPIPGGRVLVVEEVPRPGSLDCARQAAYLDPSGAPFPWRVRSPLPGDRFRPLGMTGSQKVKDLLINEKVPPEERRRVPLLESAGRVLWVAGVKMGHEARVKGGAGTVFRVELLDVTP